MTLGFNPLNQVYVFNEIDCFYWNEMGRIRLNPLNQVYVFNQIMKSLLIWRVIQKVLIP